MNKKLIMCFILVMSLLLVGCGESELVIKETDNLKTITNKVIDNEVGKSYERDVSLIDDVINNGKIVSINLNMKGGGRISLLARAADIFENLFQIKEVTEVQIWYTADLVDNKGQVTNENVMKIILKKETANEIGWDRFNVKAFPDVADDYWEHYAYSE